MGKEGPGRELKLPKTGFQLIVKCQRPLYIHLIVLFQASELFKTAELYNLWTMIGAGVEITEKWLYNISLS